MSSHNPNPNIGSSNALNTCPDTTSNTSKLKRGSGDVGWEYGVLCNPTNMDRWKCLKCGKEGGGGVHRLKLHIAGIKGNVSSCTKASNEDKKRCFEAIGEGKKKKERKRNEDESLRSEVHIEELNEIEDMESGGLTKKMPRRLGPLDRHVSEINPDVTLPMTKKQQDIQDAISKERRHKVNLHVSRWVYEHGIPFNAIDNDGFRRACEAIGQFGPNYQPPSQYQLREPLLKEEVERTKLTLKNHEEEWKRNGCSIMTDAWSDGNRRSIMNLCVNSRIGTVFLSSKDASCDAHTGEYIFKYVYECIESIGEENVVQVVTDNASNNMTAADLLLRKRPHIFWTSCATHTINLMLEGIGKLSFYKNTIAKAKSFTIFIYSHHKTLQMMRKCTNREIIRPGVTRFATAFLTLQSLIDKKAELRQMVHSTEWDASKWSKHKKGKEAYSIIIQPSFWSGVGLTLKVFAPLVKVLKLVDGDIKLAMGFVYGDLRKAKDEIKEAFKNNESKYKPIFDIIHEKGHGRIDTPLHLLAYVLNPHYYYKDNLTWSTDERSFVMDGVFECIEKLFSDVEIQANVLNVEFVKYKNQEGAFGKSFAIKGYEKNDASYDPVAWWSTYGSHTPLLRPVAMKILSLTTSSSGCERNWSVFEGIHTKKRNRLDTNRMNKLVYVQFNARLTNKKKKRSDKIDSLLVNTAQHAQAWIVDGLEDEEIIPGTGFTWGLASEVSGANEELLPRRSDRNQNVVDEVRELDEDDFISDRTEDEEDDEELFLESDKEIDVGIGIGDDLEDANDE